MINRTIKTTHCNIEIAESDGKGKTILFIHGNSSCKEVFRHQINGDVGKLFHCIAMDLPGHGNSGNALIPEQTYTMSGYADVVLQVMRSLGVTSYVIVGWSLGGHIAVETLSLTDEIAGLMISGTPPVGKNPDDLASAFLPSEHMAFTGQENLSADEADRYARATCGTAANYEPFLGEAVLRTDGRARRLMMEAVGQGKGADQRNVVKTSLIPIAVVNGADEEMVNNDYLKTVAFGNLWRRRIHLLPNVGHAPFWESPKEFDRLILEYMKDV